MKARISPSSTPSVARVASSNPCCLAVAVVVLFVATSNLNLTIAVSAVLAVLQVIVRLIQRQSVMERGLWSGGGRHLPDLGMADS